MTRNELSRSRYVVRIGWSLKDIPWSERQALLDDVSTHLRDAGPEPEDLEGWIEKFGSPEDYARRLRDGLGMGTDPASLRRARRPNVRHERLRTKVVLAAAAVAVCVIPLALVWVSNYQPLGFGLTAAHNNAEHISAGDSSAMRWRSSQGGQLAVGALLRNDGPTSVRVTELPLPAISVPWANWRVTLTDRDDFVDATDRPFHPFTLEPGEAQLVWFRGDLVPCPEPFSVGGGSEISSIEVTFEVLGVARHERLSLGFSYGVMVDPGCPTP